MKVENVRDMIQKIVLNPELKIGTGKVFQSEEMSFYLAQVASEIPAHYHKLSDETYYVYRGQGTMRVNDEYRDVSAGDIVFIPKGSIHGMKNTGTEDVIIFFISAPAFDPETDRFVAD